MEEESKWGKTVRTKLTWDAFEMMSYMGLDEILGTH
jgi:hypothetical protein